MKKTLLALGLSLWATIAQANVPCTLPFNLQNGVDADATQVMANYNALVACLTNAAAAGANTDITSLLGLTTPIPKAAGGTTTWTGGTSTGPANTQVLASVVPAGFALTAGNRVSFLAGTTNTDAMTLNVISLGATPVYRRTQTGPLPMVGGEIVAGTWVEVVYDGTQFQIEGGAPTVVGSFIDYPNAAALPGTLITDGRCLLRAGTYAPLFAVVGTTYDPTGSTCDGAHFALPDFRGRFVAYDDQMGTQGAAGRITSAGSGCNAAVLGGAGCGAQNRTIAQVNIPNYSLPVSDPTHTHVYLQGGAQAAVSLGGAVTVTAFPQGNMLLTSASATGVTVGSGGSGTALATLNPTQIIIKLIRY